jgi:hypothetical protein
MTKKCLYQDDNDNLVYFGQSGYEDYTKHKNKDRQKLCLKRASKIDFPIPDNDIL